MIVFFHKVLNRLKIAIGFFIPISIKRFLLKLWKLTYIISPFSIKLKREIPTNYKIGMAVLAFERPGYLRACLDSLFQTEIENYDITFLLQDDGSSDPLVKDILNMERSPKYKIHRLFTEKGHHSAGAAINKAMRNLMEIDEFDIIGWCDPDTIYNKKWLDKLMKVAIWAKKKNRTHLLGSFSAFNSSDPGHIVQGPFHTPYGSYIIKNKMGLANNFYFKEDFLKLGFFEEDMHEEAIMAQKFKKLKVSNFCLNESYVEHIGIKSSLNDQARIDRIKKQPDRYVRAPHGRNMPSSNWPNFIFEHETLGYYKYIKGSETFGLDISPSDMELDVVILVAKKDLMILDLTVESVMKYLKHPVNNFFIIGKEDKKIEKIISKFQCTFIDENEIVPLKNTEIDFSYNGIDRSKWIYQQLIKLSTDKLTGSKHVFTIDADTLLTSPQIFHKNGKTLFLHSDEFHFPYFIHLEKLLKFIPELELSFVAHQMIMDKERLSEMKQKIEKIQEQNWIHAIISLLNKSFKSPFSEFETYGHWMFNNYPDEVFREYWFNKRLDRKDYLIAEELVKSGSNNIRSLSLHC